MKTNTILKNKIDKTTIVYLLILIGFITIALLIPENMDSYGMLSALPPIFLLTYVILTKRILDGLVLGSLLCYVMMYKSGFLAPFNENLLATSMDETTVWVVIVCALLGSVIALLEKSGGAHAFGEWVIKKAKTRKSSLLWTWFLGVAVFIDDYLSALAVGSSMKKVTDKHNVSREMLEKEQDLRTLLKLYHLVFMHGFHYL